MQKNTVSKWIVFAFQDEGGANPGEPVTGDAAQITANLRIDGGGADAVDDTNPTELEDGYYVFDITAAESDGDLLLICPQSATGNVNVIGVPGAIYTTPPYFSTMGIESDGDLTKVNSLDGHTVQTGDTYALAAGSTGFAAIDTVVDAILVYTAEIGAAGAGLTAVPWNASWDAEVESEVTDSLVAHNLDHLCLTATAGSDMTTEVADNTILSRMLAAGDTSAYEPGTESLDAIVTQLDTIAAGSVLNTAHTEPTGVPASNETLADKIGYVFAALTNVVTVTGSAMTLYDGADTPMWKKNLADDGSTFTEGKATSV
jgi:hypothetical protein